MEQSFSAVIVSVGTEITDGQIVDRNSSWLSQRLLGLEIATELHVSVADDPQKIDEALSWVKRSLGENGLIVLTGGLGPTKDDLTREAVCRVWGETLEFDVASWTQIVDRLKVRGVPVTENQKQQCYFPRNAQILKNTVGTANAFFLAPKDGACCLVLPGPPREIEGLWSSSIETLLSQLLLVRRPDGGRAASRKLFSLQTMGVGEGLVATRVESIIDQFLASSHTDGRTRPEIGYRAHAPFVEVKIWSHRENEAWVKDLVSSLEIELADCIVPGSEADRIHNFLELFKLKKHDGLLIKTAIVEDCATGGLFETVVRRAAKEHQILIPPGFVFASGPSVPVWRVEQEEASLRLRLVEISDSAFEIIFEKRLLSAAEGQPLIRRALRVPSFYGSLSLERARLWAAERVLIELHTLRL